MSLNLNDSGYDGSPLSKKLKTSSGKPIVIKDNIHDLIEVPPLCTLILNTPEFDRLRSIKQLGLTHYVFPSATHTRFSHSLGVMHLAGKFVSALQQATPGCCNEKDKLCVQVAGLCHDLGHGPYSHLWETFLSEVGGDSQYSHEETSLKILEKILNRIDHALEKDDVDFIKELILPTEPLGDKDSDWQYSGRGKDKAFLYEIICNKKTGLDVDKMDYMARDSAALGMNCTFQSSRYFSGAKVVEDKEDNDKCVIAVKEKVLEDTHSLYLDRSRLHRNAYQHNTVKVLERMLLDMLQEANPTLDIIGNKFVKISEAHQNIEDFIKISDDHLLKSIENKGTNKAKHILKRIQERSLYPVIYTENFVNFKRTAKECEKQLNESMDNDKDIAVLIKRVNMGSKNRNPLENVLYYKKDNDKTLFNQLPEEMRYNLPTYLGIITVLVVCRSLNEEVVSQAKEVIKMNGRKFIEEAGKKLVETKSYDN